MRHLKLCHYRFSKFVRVFHFHLLVWVLKTEVHTLKFWTPSKIFINFNNLFLDKGCGHKLTHTNKNEITINLYPVCYQSLSIILFFSRSVKSHSTQRFVTPSKINLILRPWYLEHPTRLISMVFWRSVIRRTLKAKNFMRRLFW